MYIITSVRIHTVGNSWSAFSDTRGHRGSAPYLNWHWTGVPKFDAIPAREMMKARAGFHEFDAYPCADPSSWL
jgi:hypothetical protein